MRPLSRLADWVAPGQMHQSFNLDFVRTLWERAALANVVVDSLAAFDAVGAPITWLLSNHDVSRHASRFGLDGVALDLGGRDRSTGPTAAYGAWTRAGPCGLRR